MLGTGTCHAQFTIRKSAAETQEPPRVFDRLPAVQPRNDYFDPAAERAKRLKLRKERNTIEFNASLETSLQQFEHWTGSGSNNFYALANIFFRHQYKKEKLSIDYRADATYGMNFIDDAFFKNKDEFKINWQLGWEMHRNWSYSASINIRSQFSQGYKSRTEHILVSDFMSPGYFDIAAGFTYAKAGSPFKITLSPLGGNIVTDAFGVVAMVAMTPLITVQLMGLVAQLKTRKARSAQPLLDTAALLAELPDDAIIEL